MAHSHRDVGYGARRYEDINYSMNKPQGEANKFRIVNIPNN